MSIPAWFGQPGASVRRIAGRVTFQGVPAAGAVVELGSELSDAAVVPKARRVTGADGRFDFGLQPPAQYHVAASAARRTPAVRLVDARSPAANSERLELMLGDCEAALFGQVSDSSGGPIVGAQLCYAPPRGAACVASGDDGRYEMCVSPQQQTVDVSARGYGAVQEPTFFTSRRVRRDFVLTPEATLVGRVVRARDGGAIAGADVRSLSGEPGLRQAASTATVTDAQGHFVLTGLAPGRHRLVARAAGLATSDAVDVSVEAGRTSPEIVLRLNTAARLRGVVVGGDSRRPVAGALVSIAGGAAKIERLPGVDAVTQADGSFVLDAVPQGTVMFAVAGQELLEPKSLVVKAASVDGVRLVVRALGSIAGRVTRKGIPVAGVEVGCGLFSEPVFSENDGSYTIAGLRQQSCRVLATDRRSGVCGLSPLVALAAGGQRSGVDVEMDWAGAISGTVVEADGTPAASVQVRFNALHASEGAAAVTGPDGKFRVGGLLGGDDYRGDVVESAASRHHLAPADGEFAVVHLADGQSEVGGVRLVVERSHAAIAGHVVDDGGQPVSDVQVTAFRAAGGDERPNLNESFDAPRTISTADGSFRIDDVDSGAFVLVAHAGDGSEGRLAGIAAGQSGVTLRLQAAGGIDGKLVGFDTPPEVTAFEEAPFTPRARAYAFVDGDTFHFRGLPPGTYLVDAAGTGGDVTTVEVTGGQTAVVTLRNRGTATIHGRVVEWRSGSGVPGLTCKSMLFGARTFSRPQGQPTFTDDSGAFTLEGVPAGPSIVICFGDPASSDGLARVDVAAGDAATCQVVVVKGRATDTLGFFGGEIGVDASLTVSILTVLANSPAARAGIRRGDVLATVDGLSVQTLSPIGNELAIRDRPVGQSVPIGVLRGGQLVTTNVVIASSAGF